MKHFLLLILILFIPSQVFSKPYLPENDNYVLLKLPSEIIGNKKSKINILKDKIGKNPEDEYSLVELTKEYIKLGRKTSDPRYFSYANLIVEKTIDKSQRKSEFYLLRGTIKQYNHNFISALEDLNKSLEINRHDPQAWLTRASVLQVIGKYNEAKKSCIPLIGLTNEVISSACIVSSTSLLGGLNQSISTFENIIQKNDISSLSEKGWIYSILAEMKERSGDFSGAEKYYKLGLNAEVDSVSLLTSYSDFLISQKRYKEVVSLLSNKSSSESLLVRLSIAEKKLSLPQYEEDLSKLKKMFFEEHLRGDFIHYREECLYDLYLLEDVESAYLLAVKNWNIQKEPIDIFLVLNLAMKANDKKTIDEVILFIKENKLEDVRLNKLIKDFQN